MGGRAGFRQRETPFLFCSYRSISNGRVVRATASGAIHVGLIPNQVKAMTGKYSFPASRSATMGQREEQAGSLLVVRDGRDTQFLS